MRDPERIKPLLDEIGELWKQKCPDLRFMQLIENFQSYTLRDCFYMEDDEFIQIFRDFMKRFWEVDND